MRGDQPRPPLIRVAASPISHTYLAQELPRLEKCLAAACDDLLTLPVAREPITAQLGAARSDWAQHMLLCLFQNSRMPGLGAPLLLSGELAASMLTEDLGQSSAQPTSVEHVLGAAAVLLGLAAILSCIAAGACLPFWWYQPLPVWLEILAQILPGNGDESECVFGFTAKIRPRLVVGLLTWFRQPEVSFRCPAGSRHPRRGLHLQDCPTVCGSVRSYGAGSEVA